MPIIDSQVHAYEANTPKRPWHSVPNWPPHVTGDEMVAAMDRVGVDGAIFISAFFRSPVRRELCRRGATQAPRALRAHQAGSGGRRGHRRVEEAAGRGRRAHHDHGARSGPAAGRSGQRYPFADIWDPLERLFDAWGLDRCLWGTDWTRAFAVVNYEQAVEPFLRTDRLSERERAMLMGGACAKAYG